MTASRTGHLAGVGGGSGGGGSSAPARGLATLLKGLPITIRATGRAEAVTGVVEDSRHVTPGCLFVARSGTATDGARYIDDAIASGAAAVLTDPEQTLDAPGVLHLVARDVPAAAARIAERFHGSPSRSLDLVGITGTNGKTTVAYLVHEMLNGQDRRCGLIGTVAIDDGSAPFTGGRTLPAATLTTPPAFETSRRLRTMVDHGCRACVMETSSHALDQGRTAGLSFAGAIFTNLSGDHLDYHGTMERYVSAKTRLVASVPEDGWVVINVDDPAAGAMIGATGARVIDASLERADATCFAAIDGMTIAGAAVRFRGPWGTFECALPLVGRHNVANALHAAAAVAALGLDAEQIRRELARAVAPPGRLERVTAPGDAITVLVDYAHTDDALRNVLSALRPLVAAPSRLMTVFGCGGDRDRTKRPRMAAAAEAHSDVVYITSDNPRTEEPAAIVDEVVTGLARPSADTVHRIVDRGEAIHAAIASARPGDVVVIAGKGHEDYQIVGTERRAFDDRLVAGDALAVCGHAWVTPS